ncbi:MAG: hypothetical protein IPK97_17545 [Ahniella sp.]|nr:hypothetical protein [Ahniella sp.]
MKRLLFAMLLGHAGLVSAQGTSVDTPRYTYFYNPGATSAPQPYNGTWRTAHAWLYVYSFNGSSFVVPTTEVVTLRTTLPAGLTYAGWDGARWTCSAINQDVTCISNGTLPVWPTDLGGILQLYTDIPSTMAAGTTVSFDLRWSTPTYPGNPAGACTFANQCRPAGSTIRQSRLTNSLSTTPLGSFPWTPGAQRTLQLSVSGTGYNQNNGEVSSTYYLPPKVTFLGADPLGSNPLPNCSAGAVTASGQVVTCQGTQLSNVPSDPTGSTGVILRVALAADLPAPASIQIKATSGVAEQPQRAPELCVGSPLPDGCAVLNINTTTAIVPRMIFNRSLLPDVGMSLTPMVIDWLAPQPSTLRLEYRNIGTAAGTTSRLHVQLPPGLAYQGINSSSPTATCAATGSVAVGQLLSCQAAGLAINANGSLRVNVLPETTIGDVSDILAGVNADASVTAETQLDACVLTPTREDCAMLEVAPTFAACNGRYGASGIFCNGYE